MMVDVAELVSVMRLADVDALCDSAENLGSECRACPVGDSDSSIPVVARGLVAPMAGLDVTHVEETNAIAGCELWSAVAAASDIERRARALVPAV